MSSSGVTQDAKETALRQIIDQLERVTVAYSGGVDSSYLLAVCLDVLGREHVLALTVDSPLMPRAELRTAQDVAGLLGATHRILPFDDLTVPEVTTNPPRRCYFCKRARFLALQAILGEAHDSHLVHGENADDHLDYRPGTEAARELHVRAPLAEAGLTKAEIRELSRRRGLPTWDHPAAACLASRFPYGTALTRAGLRRVEQAEEYLHDLLPNTQVRLRDHSPIARIEVPAQAIPHLASEQVRTAIIEKLRLLGYHYVTLDLEGYRMGSMNDGIAAST